VKYKLTLKNREGLLCDLRLASAFSAVKKLLAAEIAKNFRNQNAWYRNLPGLNFRQSLADTTAE
jgi:hypothetical protein